MYQVILPPTALGRTDFLALNRQILDQLKQRLQLHQTVITSASDRSCIALSDGLCAGFLAYADTLRSPIGVYYGQIQFRPLEYQTAFHTWTITQCFERFKPIVHVNYRAPGSRKLVPLTLDQEITIDNASRRTGRGSLLDHLVEQAQQYGS